MRPAARTLARADRLSVPLVLANAIRYTDTGQHKVADVVDAARVRGPDHRPVPLYPPTVATPMRPLLRIRPNLRAPLPPQVPPRSERVRV